MDGSPLRAALLVLAGVVVVAAGVGWAWGSERADTVTMSAQRVAVPGGPDGDEVTLDTALYRPAAATADTPAPALLLGHGFGGDRFGVDEIARDLAASGYVVLTWTARGFGTSTGAIHLASQDAEIADVSALIDVLSERGDVAIDTAGDPRVGIVGGSYAGGTALLAASADPRIDVVVAVGAWHDLSEALAPDGGGGDGVLSVGWTSVLFTGGGLSSGVLADGDEATDQGALAPDEAPTPCGRFTPEICAAYEESVPAGTLTPAAAGLLQASSPSTVPPAPVPTLLVHGQRDTLFAKEHAARNAQAVQATGAPVRLVWLPGGHEEVGSVPPASRTADEVRTWLDQWLPADRRDGERDGQEAPTFTWVDESSGGDSDGDRLPPIGSATVDSEAGRWSVHASADGRLVAREEEAATGARTLTNPPGGQPAAVSSLPGLGALGRQLPAMDVPGQHAVFDSAPLDGPLTILGAPRLRLEVSGAEDDAVVFVKLSEVAPDGDVALLDQAVTPVRLEGGDQDLPIELGALAHRLPEGARLRLTIATTDQRYANDVRASTVTLEAGPRMTIGLPVSPDAGATGTSSTLIALAFSAALVLGLVGLVWWRSSRARRRGPLAGPPDVPPIMIRGLTKRYADGQLAVNGLDLTVEKGQVFGLLGPNGAGKTSTLRMLLGLTAADQGTLEILGQHVRPGHPVLSRVGALVEGPGLAPHLTGRRNLEQYWRAGGRPIAQADLDHALGVAALGTAIDKQVRTYSHGMRQRLAIAQAMLGRPEVLVLDEPTDGLDPEQIQQMRRRLARLGETGTTVLVSSHLLAEVEQMCTHVAVMHAGTVRASGSIAQVVGATRSVVVETNDRQAARAVLAARVGPEAVHTQGAGLVVELGDHRAADLVADLVAAGVRVQGLTSRGRLEDAFLSLTGDAR